MGFMDYLDEQLSKKQTIVKPKVSSTPAPAKEEKKPEPKKELTIEEQIQLKVNSLLEQAGSIQLPKVSKVEQDITDYVNKILGG